MTSATALEETKHMLSEVADHAEEIEIPLAELQILIKVVTEDGEALPEFLFHESAISSRCLLACGHEPLEIQVLNGKEALLSYAEGVNVTTTAMAICKLDEWYGTRVHIQGSIATEETRRTMYGDAYCPKTAGRYDTGTPVDPTKQVTLTEIAGDLLDRVTEHVDRQVSELRAQLKDSQDKLKEEVSKTTMIPTGNSLAIPEVLLHTKGGKVPKINPFSGSEVVGKGEVSYAQWAYEVKTLQPSYGENLLREGILRSLKGTAADLVRYLGPQASLQKILDKLETVYGAVSTFDQLMLGLYSLKQEKAEKIQQFATRLEEAVNQIALQFPGDMKQMSVAKHLKDRLFHGMRKTLRDTIRFQFEKVDSTYESLLMNAKRAEAEEGGSSGTTTVKAKAVSEVTETVESKELTDLKEQMATLMAAVGNFNSNHRGNGNHKKVRFAEDDKTKTGMPPKGVPRCYNCKGWGHLRRDCPSPYLNLKGGEENTKPLPKPSEQNPMMQTMDHRYTPPEGFLELAISRRPPTPPTQGEGKPGKSQ